MESRADILRARCERAGQGHVFAFFDALDGGARERLLAQVAALDFELLPTLVELVRAPVAAAAAPRFAPPEVFPLARAGDAAARARSARERGRQLLRAGHVAYLLVAGGQASRLGHHGPKGTFPIGPVSGQSLFEVFARKLAAAHARFGAPVRWYVMTSQANDRATRAFFDEHAFFGLDPDSVFFFSQAMLPALDVHGRILMSAKDELFLAPNGHGGVLSSLARSGGLEHARARGVRTFSYFQVDNPLAPPADPVFLGLHALEQAQMSSKVVMKRDAAEKVGVLGRVDERLCCIEYSDLPAQQRDARDERGALLFGAGNVALHALELEFVERLTHGALELPWHLARKRVAALDAHGAPTHVEGIKFETFVFDALQFAERSATLEVDRSAEFSPVKNAHGEDSPARARADLCRLHASWVEQAGLPLPPAGVDGIRPVEVDPLFATDLEAFLARMPAEPEISPRGHFYR